jgi:hypothetical protein
MVPETPERGKPRGVVTHLSAEELRVHMRSVAAQRTLYSSIGKAVVEIVERSRQEQGLPSRVSDTSTLNKIADLVSGAAP